MVRLFFSSIVTSFAIVGAVVGAGFITGKEILVFFASDFSLSGIYLTFIVFTLSMLLIVSFSFSEKSKKVIEAFVSVSNVFIAGCMFCALSELYKSVFFKMKNIEIFAIFTAILVFIISIGGMSAMKYFNLVLIPIITISIIFLCFMKIDDYEVLITPKTLVGVFNPVVYVGFNVVLSFVVIKNGGESLPPPYRLLCCIITSFILSFLITLISLSILHCEKTSAMPFVSMFNSDVKLSIIVDIITVFAILTTYVSALYSSFKILGKSQKVGYKLGVFLLSILFSNLGFSKIVDTIYPIIGIVGFLLLLIICLLSKLFQARQPKRTLRLLKRRE